MAKYVYPAVFTAEDNGLYSVNFPDIECCYTSGEDLADAIDMAEDVLNLCLCQLENGKKDIPAPSDPRNIKVEQNEIVTYISCDTIKYRREHENRSVKKTLTIPAWMNAAAEAENINFSALLQEAIMEKLQLK